MRSAMLLALWLALAQVTERHSEDSVRALEQAQASLNRAREAEAARDNDAAREAVHAGLAALRSVESTRDSPDGERLSFALGGVARRMGDLLAAREGWERSRAWREEHLAPDDPRLQEIRTNVAVAMKEMGDRESARVLEEQVLEVCECTLPGHDPFRMAARNNLALTLWSLGDLFGARALLEREVAARERWLPSGDRRLLNVLGNLGSVLEEMGDQIAARVVLERVVDGMQAALGRPDLSPSGDPSWSDGAIRNQRESELCTVRESLAAVLGRLGDRWGALEQHELALAWREEHLPPGNLQLNFSRLRVAECLTKWDDFGRAHHLIELATRGFGYTLPPDAPLFASIDSLRADLAMIQGDCAEGLRLARGLSEVLDQLDSHERGARLVSAIDCLNAAACAGEEDLSPFIADMLDQVELALRSALALSPREASAVAISALGNLQVVMQKLALIPPTDELARRVFEIIESIRQLGVRSMPATRPADAEGNALREAAQRASDVVNRLVVELEAGSDATQAASAEFQTAVLARDRAQARLAAHLFGSDSGRMLEVASIAGSLARDAAFAGYMVFSKAPDPRRFDADGSEDVLSILAHVVRSDGSLARVELGSLAEIEAAVLGWRAAIGRGVGIRPATSDGFAARAAEAEEIFRGEPVSVREGSIDDGTARLAGDRLRKLVLDPVMRAAGTVRTLHICVDDVLALVPFDALPDAEGVVGDRVRIVLETSLGRILDPRPECAAEPLLVAFGGLEFGPLEERTRARESVLPGVESAGMRSGAGGGFLPLPASASEVDALGGLFSSAFGLEPLVARGSIGTKQRLIELAPRARYLHIATHGYSASEALRPSPNDLHSRARPLSAQSAARGLAPMALCGLALAGANAGIGATGRADGVITAEELAGLDLSRCELAVLSACETHVHSGPRRAGAAVQSLQAALHAAGARTALTTLWAVDDDQARELVLAFYRGVWIGKLPKSESLWRAKQSLRARNVPVRDWGGWVLSGDPN